MRKLSLQSKWIAEADGCRTLEHNIYKKPLCEVFVAVHATNCMLLSSVCDWNSYKRIHGNTYSPSCGQLHCPFNTERGYKGKTPQHTICVCVCVAPIGPVALLWGACADEPQR